ncbi:MAG: 3'(2'),5'-bisphosphate nucleotidase [Candidatus Marinimicrobia bacterium]|nr:3'(2'),5'-bisphosphate nucleotidase [candidate division WOR-3 bacterium]MCK4448240.1 3'(2'),5'-bisphosphate nucleotidase [Candidatus Neomarinimicrobiota bacterium]
MTHKLEQEVAIQAVIGSSKFFDYLKNNNVKIQKIIKQDNSPVTIADYGSQIIIMNEILSSFPHDIINSEENLSLLKHKQSEIDKFTLFDIIRKINPNITIKQLDRVINNEGSKATRKKRFWVLDPLDGTKGFLRGNQYQYAISLSLIENGFVKLGVLCCPNLFFKISKQKKYHGCIFIANRGKGTYIFTLDKYVVQKAHVNTISNPENAIFCESYEKSHTSHENHNKIAALLGIKASPIRMDSQCKYALVSRGDISIYFRLPKKLNSFEKIWDHAAGAIIIEESGGKVTDALGRQLNFTAGNKLTNNYGVIATNGYLHNKVVEATREILKSSPH